MKKLKISTKITLAYFVLSAVLLAILIPTVYFVVENSLRDGLSGSMQLSASAVEGAMSEKKGKVRVNESALSEDAIKQGVFVVVTDNDENTLWESMNADMVFDMAHFKNGTVTEDEDWSFIRKTATVGNQQVNINVLGNIYFNDFLSDFVWGLLLLVPGYLLLAVIGAKLLARNALKPVRQITGTAKKISEGDLSNRIEGISSRDEVGELADMFNRMIEALQKSFQRERQFTSDASHELRTPMTVIQACTEDALCTEDEGIRLENLHMIQKENERMTKLLAQLLMLSRGYEGRYHFQPEKMNLYDVADSVMESMDPMASLRSIHIHNQVPEEVSIRADQSLLTQLLVNLVENAIKYGRDGGNIWICTEEQGGIRTLCVRDDGVGISTEDVPNIFERFYRADKARNRSGSGLGLSIAKWIAVLHGWDISAESQLGKGTTMRIKGF